MSDQSPARRRTPSWATASTKPAMPPRGPTVTTPGAKHQSVVMQRLPGPFANLLAGLATAAGTGGTRVGEWMRAWRAKFGKPAGTATKNAPPARVAAPLSARKAPPTPVPARPIPGAQARDPARKRAPDDADAALLSTPAATESRAREIARISAILMSPAAAASWDVAQALANSDATVADALAILTSLPNPAAERAAISATRAARNPSIGCGVPAAASPQRAAAASWDGAFAQAAGKR